MVSHAKFKGPFKVSKKRQERRDALFADQHQEANTPIAPVKSAQVKFAVPDAKETNQLHEYQSLTTTELMLKEEHGPTTELTLEQHASIMQRMSGKSNEQKTSIIESLCISDREKIRLLRAYVWPDMKERLSGPYITDMETSVTNRNRAVYGLGPKEMTAVADHVTGKTFKEMQAIFDSLPITPKQKAGLHALWIGRPIYDVEKSPDIDAITVKLYGLTGSQMNQFIRSVNGKTLEERIELISSLLITPTQKCALHDRYVIGTGMTATEKKAVETKNEYQEVLEAMDFYIKTQPTGLVARTLVRELAPWIQIPNMPDTPRDRLMTYIFKLPFDQTVIETKKMVEYTKLTKGISIFT